MTLPPLPRLLLPLLCALGAGAHAAEGPVEEGLPKDARCAPLAVRGRGPNLCIRGNAVLAEGVYRAVVAAPQGAQADEETAASVQRQLSSFLVNAGYTLGSVAVTVEGQDLLADVEEGQLERVVLRGRLTWRALRLWLGLSIPSGVFNEGELLQQLARLQEELKLTRAWYELVPTRGVQHRGPQADELAVLQGMGVAETRRAYELHVFVEEPDWHTGVGAEVRSSALYGQEVLGVYQGAGLFFAADRWSARVGAGVRLQERISDEKLRPALSRVLTELRWFAPPLAGITRPFLLLDADASGRQRPDLQLESYRQLATAGSLNLLVQPVPRLTLSVGSGVRFTHLQDVVAVDGTSGLPASAVDVPRWHAFVQARAERTFGGEAGRVDRLHALTLEARHHSGISAPSYTETRAEYRHSWGLGWHDLLVRARGTYLMGPVPFPEEEPLSRHLRGVARDQYIKRGASLSTELQISLLRDVYRVSVFHDLAGFGRLDREQGGEQAAWGNSFGLGLHALYEGTLQLNLYGALGHTPARHGLGSGFVLELQKVF